MKDSMNTKITIPFQGFYGSVHEYLIDYAFEYEASDANGNPCCERMDVLHNAVDHNILYFYYAQEYVQQLAHKYLPGVHINLVKVVSPREYNFRNDELDAEISMQDVLDMYAAVDKQLLAAIVKERHSSRSGFISFYPDSVYDWGKVKDWDHHQLCTLLYTRLVEVVDSNDWGSDEELSLMEDINCSEMIWKALPKGFDLDAAVAAKTATN